MTTFQDNATQLDNDAVQALAKVLGAVTVTLPDGSVSDLAKELTLAAVNDKPETGESKDKYFVSGEFMEVPIATAKPLLAAYKARKAEADKAKEALEAAETKLRELLDFHEVLVAAETGQYLVESRVNEAQVLDTAKFKKENPDLAVKYLRPRRSRSFRVLV